MIYFISGHRDLTQEEFDANYAPAIEDAIEVVKYRNGLILKQNLMSTL